MLREFVSRTPLQRRRRAVGKTLCYRLFMLLITVGVAWFVVGDVSDALNIGVGTNVIKTATYYGYERLWDRIDWGV